MKKKILVKTTEPGGVHLNSVNDLRYLMLSLQPDFCVRVIYDNRNVSIGDHFRVATLICGVDSEIELEVEYGSEVQLETFLEKIKNHNFVQCDVSAG